MNSSGPHNGGLVFGMLGMSFCCHMNRFTAFDPIAGEGGDDDMELPTD